MKLKEKMMSKSKMMMKKRLRRGKSKSKDMMADGKGMMVGGY